MPSIEQTRAGDGAATIHQAGAPDEIARTDEDGFTPLMIASALGQSRMVETLLDAGADVLALEPGMGLTALHLAARSGNPDVLSLLLDHGAIIDQPSATLGHTALMDALLHKHEAAVRVLLERGAKTTIRTHYGMTAADIGRADGPVRISLACLHGLGDLAHALCRRRSIGRGGRFRGTCLGAPATETTDLAMSRPGSNCELTASGRSRHRERTYGSSQNEPR